MGWDFGGGYAATTIALITLVPITFVTLNSIILIAIGFRMEHQARGPVPPRNTLDYSDPMELVLASATGNLASSIDHHIPEKRPSLRVNLRVDRYGRPSLMAGQ